MTRGFVIDYGPEAPPPPPPAPEAPPAEVPRGVIVRLRRELRENILAKASAHSGERSQLRKAFHDIDADGSGLIDYAEFIRALERFGLHTLNYGLKGGAGGLSEETVRALFDSFDADGSGYLEMKEFEEALLMPERPAPAPAFRAKPRLRGAGQGYAG